jgi:colanic acid biosynthesis glycosyl transferase WcaI
VAQRPSPLTPSVSRVLILSLVFPPDSVSTAEIMGDLALDLRARGHDVAVFTTVPHYNRDLDAERRQPMRRVWGPLLSKSNYGGVPVYHAAMPAKTPSVVGRIAAWVGFHAVSTVAAVLLADRPDVIIVPSPPLSIGASAWIVGVLRRARYIYNVQEIYPDIAVNLGALKHPRAIRIFEALERFVYRKSAAVTVIAPRMRTRLVDKGVPPGKVHVIPNGVDLERLTPGQRHNDFSRRHGLDDIVAITYAGNMGPAQGLEIVIDAARLLGPGDALRFVLIGEGSLRARLTSDAAGLPQKNVMVLPYQPNALMPQIYGASDISLVPQAAATGSDAIPSKVYRIMASGRPLIAVTEADSDLAALVNAAGCGVVVAPGDARHLAELVREAPRRLADWREMGLRGRAHVTAHYTRAIVCDRYDALIREVRAGRAV